MSPTREAFSVRRSDEADPLRTSLSSETRFAGTTAFATDDDIESIFASLSYLLDGDDGANDATAPDAPVDSACEPPPTRRPAPVQDIIHIDDSWLEEGPPAVTTRMPADYPARVTLRPARMDVPAAARPSRPGFLSSRHREVVTPLMASLTAAASAAMPSTATAAPAVSSPYATIRDSAPLSSRSSRGLGLPMKKLALPAPKPPPRKSLALPPRPPPLPPRPPLLPVPPMPPAPPLLPAAPPTADTGPLVAPPAATRSLPAPQPGARAARTFGLTAIAGAVLTAGMSLAMLFHARSLPGTMAAPASNVMSAAVAPPEPPVPPPTPPRAAPAAPAVPAPPAAPKGRTMPRALPSEPFGPAPRVTEPPRMVVAPSPPPPAAPPPFSPAPLPAAALPAARSASAAIPSTGPVVFDDR
jgi:hypothetical protein